MNDDLFNDGWRDPSDDGERLMGYIIACIGFLVGCAFTVCGLVAMFTGRFPGEHPNRAQAHDGTVYIGIAATLIGLAIAGGVGMFFAEESKHWDFRGINAERIVSGGFLLGFAFIGIGLMFLRGAHGGAPVSNKGGLLGMLVATFGFIGLGVADLLVFLVVGLVCAYWPALAIRSRRFAGVFVEARFALDENGIEDIDHPCPATDGMLPMVRLRTADRKMLTLRCTGTTYDFAHSGSMGNATVRGDKLIDFVITRRAPS